ncbi:uncharacterized protein LOC123684072 [Harmonia axyridis]|uniref:uncharacterized protein LOC123684072 n=1 Tax=Harmonia axyridis TaxID=115357 RepID=UPI001E2760B7|nr:uncharacterized protein LOC123684072 [Harmonia axyridis]
MLNRDKCDRIISHCDEEKPSFQSKVWWNKLFKKLEEESSIAPEKRLEVLEAIFPNHLLRRIVDLIDLDQKSKEKLKGLAALKFPCEGPLTFPPIAPADRYAPRESKAKISLDNISVSISRTTSSMENQVPLKQVGKKNPYMKFFQTRHDRASIWRPMPPLSLADMNLVQKADAITERIAEEFVKWLQQMGGEATSNLSVQTIISMFEIGFNTHAAKSLCVRLKEMPTVTDLVAKKRNVPGMAKRASLLRQIHRDIEASKMEPKRIAFGRSLPSYMQRVPNKEDIAKKWLECKNVPMKLKTMQTVWEGITHLRSTRAYCEWLVNHPEIKPPQFLVENNMLDLLVLQAQRPSFDEEDAVDVEDIAAGASDLMIKGFSRPDLVSKMDVAMASTMDTRGD